MGNVHIHSSASSWLRIMYLWPVLAFMTQVFVGQVGWEYDDHAVATMIFITANVWGFPLLLTKWIFGATNEGWMFVGSLIVFSVLIESGVLLLRRMRGGRIG